MITVAWISAGLAVLALCTTVVNAVSWPRGRADLRVTNGLGERVSVLIPARNEAPRIEAAVRAALASPLPVEVLVYDDASTDGTADVVARIEDPRVRVIPGVPLPAGWVGKTHACHRLAEAAVGGRLVFVDADVTLAPEGLLRIASLHEDYDAHLVTGVPRQITGSFAEHLMLPLLHLTYTSWLPLLLVHRSQDPRFLAANGQVLSIDRRAYDAFGGFSAVRSDIVDDMALCRRAKASGHRVVFADAHAIASCRMYDSASGIWAGFSKNVYEGLGHPARLAGAVGLYLLAFVVPWIALLLAVWVPALLLPGAVGVGANLLTRLLLAARHGHRLVSIPLHPVAVLGLVAIAINSWRWSRSGRIAWAGRTYAARASRGG